jgi:hypothetical protein
MNETQRPDLTAELKQLLIQRIERYVELERPVVEQLKLLESTLDDLRTRRRAAETLYRTEFGEDPLPPADDTRSEVSEGPSRYIAAPVGPLFVMSWKEAMRHVLAEAGEPLHVRAIAERLRAGGFRSTSKDPERSIVSIAIRSPKVFERRGPNVFGLVGHREGGDA